MHEDACETSGFAHSPCGILQAQQVSLKTVGQTEHPSVSVNGSTAGSCSSADTASLHCCAILKTFFQVHALREHQHTVIEYILNPANSVCDIICRYPTASGKSIIYLLPAVERDNLIFVVSPLCSLILDQVCQLNSNTAGHRVGYNLSSSAETSREEEDAFSLDEYDWILDGGDPTAPASQHSSWRQIATASVCVQRSRVLFCTPEKLACEHLQQKLHNLH